MLNTMTSESTYFRLSKVWDLSRSPGDEQNVAIGNTTAEGLLGHHLKVGYILEGWFLETACVGRSLVMLRFRRNETWRLGVFTSSTVVSIADGEIRTLNSVYRLEHHSFEQLNDQLG